MSFKALKAKLAKSWIGKAGKAKMEFAFRIHELMTDANMSNKDLAEKIGSSNAYITKVLRGDQNLSIESIHKIADALEAEVSINMARKNFTGKWLEVSKNKQFSHLAVVPAKENVFSIEEERELQCA